MPTLNKLLTDGSISIGVTYKKTDESDYKWLQVTTSDYESLHIRLQVTKRQAMSHYECLQGTTSDYESRAKHYWISND